MPAMACPARRGAAPSSDPLGGLQAAASATPAIGVAAVSLSQKGMA